MEDEGSQDGDARVPSSPTLPRVGMSEDEDAQDEDARGDSSPTLAREREAVRARLLGRLQRSWADILRAVNDEFFEPGYNERSVFVSCYSVSREASRKMRWIWRNCWQEENNNDALFFMAIVFLIQFCSENDADEDDFGLVEEIDWEEIPDAEEAVRRIFDWFLVVRRNLNLSP